MVPRICLLSMIVAFPDNTCLFSESNRAIINMVCLEHFETDTLVHTGFRKETHPYKNCIAFKCTTSKNNSKVEFEFCME